MSGAGFEERVRLAATRTGVHRRSGDGGYAVAACHAILAVQRDFIYVGRGSTMSATAGLTKRSFTSPDERRPAGRAEGEIVTVNGISFMRITAQPGWRWQADVKP